jgi:peptidoglycan/LPS O-acetylase OafA/YrhL
LTDTFAAARPAPTPLPPLRRAPDDGARSRWFRADIEGLRAVAVLLVVLFHVGVPGLSGGYIGVDVFFVISGFLITSLLLRELAGTGRVSVAAFYARRFVRLLPAAAVVVLATLVAAWWWLPVTRWRGIATDGLLAAAYGMNFNLAARGVDYLASAAPPSPLQHFWSLAVEEQFYAVWPLLLVVSSLTWLGRGRVRGTAVAVVLGVIIAASLALSVTQTATAAPWAYFGSHTRAWELAAGALVALFAVEWARLPRAMAAAAGWLGLAAVVAAAVLYTEATPFPGLAAVLPVAGTLLVIVGGAVAPLPALLAAPMRTIGTLSYGWYLWHWPFLLIGPYALGQTPNLVQRVMLVLLALGAAALTYVAVENRLRHRAALREHPARGIALGLALSALLALVSLAGTVVPLRPVATGDAAAEFSESAVGSAAQRQLGELLAASADRETLPANLTPTLPDAAADLPPVYADGCHRDITDTDVPTPCLYGDPAARTTMVLFGDSHAAHWFTALAAVAEQRGARLAVITKSACTAADVVIVLPQLKRDYTECGQWRQAAWRRIAALRPSLVVMSSNGGGGTIAGVPAGDLDRAWADGWTTSVRTAAATGADVVVLADTPWPAGNVPECVAANPSDLVDCGRSPDRAVLEPDRRALVARATAAAGARVVDPVPWFCTTTTCPVVVGNLLVYRDESHMTTAYSAALAPVLADALP